MVDVKRKVEVDLAIAVINNVTNRMNYLSCEIRNDCGFMDAQKTYLEICSLTERMELLKKCFH